MGTAGGGKSRARSTQDALPVAAAGESTASRLSRNGNPPVQRRDRPAPSTGHRTGFAGCCSARRAEQEWAEIDTGKAEAWRRKRSAREERAIAQRASLTTAAGEAIAASAFRTCAARTPRCSSDACRMRRQAAAGSAKIVSLDCWRFVPSGFESAPIVRRA